MRCLITGGSGQIGAAVAHQRYTAGDEVAVLVRGNSDLWRLSDLHGQLRIIRGDLTDLSSAAADIADFAAHSVVHAGWDGVTQEHRNAPDHIRRNVLGSLELFRLVREAGAGTWIGLGSQAEYGAVLQPLTEQTPVRPDSAYGAAKLSVGILTRQLCAMAGMRFVWLRILATYGPADDERRLIPTVILGLLRGESPGLTTGTQRWDYLYLDDAVEAISSALDSEIVAGTFVLGSGVAVPVREIVTQIRDLVDVRIALRFGSIDEPVGAPRHLQADFSALKSASGWMPRTPLDEGLRRTITWYRAQERLIMEKDT